MRVFRYFFHKENNRKFNPKDRVLISNNILEFPIKQTTCGGFSEPLMKNILGKIGEVIYAKSNCVTVEVNGKHFDLHPDLLLHLSTSLPTKEGKSDYLDEKPLNNSVEIEKRGGSLPFFSDESILNLFDPPFDDHNESFPLSTVAIENGMITNKEYDDFHILNENALLMEPPVDNGKPSNICFDWSFQTISFNSEKLANQIPVVSNNPNQIPVESKAIKHIPVVSSNSDQISVESKVLKEISSESNIPQENVSEPIVARQVLCQHCLENVIEYAVFCGHCYCKTCLDSLDQCVVCKHPTRGNSIKIRL